MVKELPKKSWMWGIHKGQFRYEFFCFFFLVLCVVYVIHTNIGRQKYIQRPTKSTANLTACAFGSNNH